MVSGAAHRLRPDGKIVRLDIHVRARALGNRTLVESFGGIGDHEDGAFKDAFVKFLNSSFHVLLSVLVESRYGTEQVDWCVWEDANDSWRVCRSSVLVQDWPVTGTLPQGELAVKIGPELEAFYATLKDRLLPILTPEYHWVSVYLMKNGVETVGSEVLVDSLDWPEMKNLLVAHDWPMVGRYSIRHFSMLVGRI